VPIKQSRQIRGGHTAAAEIGSLPTFSFDGVCAATVQLEPLSLYASQCLVPCTVESAVQGRALLVMMSSWSEQGSREIREMQLWAFTRGAHVGCFEMRHGWEGYPCPTRHSSRFSSLHGSRDRGLFRRRLWADPIHMAF
jgi:hypothetical protein